MRDFHNFSSLPPNEEAAFVVYEQRMAQDESKGLTIGAICGAIFLFLALAVYLGVEPEKIDYGKDMDMSHVTKKAPQGK